MTFTLVLELCSYGKIWGLRFYPFSAISSSKGRTCRQFFHFSYEQWENFSIKIWGQSRGVLISSSDDQNVMHFYTGIWPRWGLQVFWNRIQLPSKISAIFTWVKVQSPMQGFLPLAGGSISTNYTQNLLLEVIWVS